jgi:hypothetical protein
MQVWKRPAARGAEASRLWPAEISGGTPLPLCHFVPRCLTAARFSLSLDSLNQ